MTYRVGLTADSLEDLHRLYDFLLERDLGAAERALTAIERALALLAYSPLPLQPFVINAKRTITDTWR
jgi:plasmid stabilization system protein ParE